MGGQLQFLQFTDDFTVKFDGAKLPSILNSLETANNGQKLVLEVAVWRNWVTLAQERSC